MATSNCWCYVARPSMIHFATRPGCLKVDFSAVPGLTANVFLRVNPGLALIGFRTNGPRLGRAMLKKIARKSSKFWTLFSAINFLLRTSLPALLQRHDLQFCPRNKIQNIAGKTAEKIAACIGSFMLSRNN